jgi:hypothetical protein
MILLQNLSHLMNFNLLDKNYSIKVNEQESHSSMGAELDAFYELFYLVDT